MTTEPPAAGRPPGAWSRALGPGAAWRRTAVGDCLSELFGTFVLMTLGLGVVAMATAALPESGRTSSAFAASGDWLFVTLGWAAAVTLAIYVAGGVSGAHLNPAVTVAFALRRSFPWRRVPGYVVAQVAGAFAGAALVYWVYLQAIDAFEAAHGIVRDGGGDVTIFVTGPADYFSTYAGPVLTEVAATAFLIVLVFAVVDLMNVPPRANLGPLVIGLAVFAIGMSFGANTGYAINPARDLGPRVLAWLAGWGDAAFPGRQGRLDAYWWVPIVAPIVGAAIGAVVYDLLIHQVLRARGVAPATGVESRGEVVEED